MDKRKLMALTSVVCILPAVACLIIYGGLPDEIPIQFNLGGPTGSTAPKWFVAFGMPGFLLLFNIFCHWKVNRTAEELEYPEVAQIFIKWAMPVISAAITAVSVEAVLDGASWMFLMAVISALVIVFGQLVYDGLLDYIGERALPWSRSEKAARLCGKIYIIVGMAAVVVSVVGQSLIAAGIIIVGIIAAAGAAVRS